MVSSGNVENVLNTSRLYDTCWTRAHLKLESVQKVEHPNIAKKDSEKFKFWGKFLGNSRKLEGNSQGIQTCTVPRGCT
jgi:hypothetical protein